MTEEANRAYLDIETTYDSGISVIGIHIPQKPLVQLLEWDVTDIGIEAALAGVDMVVTFNGTRFDLPFIKKVTGLDIRDFARHKDLLFECRRRGIKGGLKRVEVLLGIPRPSEMDDSAMAPYLWQRYVEMGDEDALKKLLAYNRDDVVNLQILEEILEGLDTGTGDK